LDLRASRRLDAGSPAGCRAAGRSIQFGNRRRRTAVRRQFGSDGFKG